MNKSYSDSTLMKFTKEELIQEIRIYEHNYNSLYVSYKRIQKILMENFDNIDIKSEE